MGLLAGCVVHSGLISCLLFDPVKESSHPCMRKSSILDVDFLRNGFQISASSLKEFTSEVLQGLSRNQSSLLEFQIMAAQGLPRY